MSSLSVDSIVYFKTITLTLISKDDAISDYPQQVQFYLFDFC